MFFAPHLSVCLNLQKIPPGYAHPHHEVVCSPSKNLNLAPMVSSASFLIRRFPFIPWGAGYSPASIKSTPDPLTVVSQVNPCLARIWGLLVAKVSHSKHMCRPKSNSGTRNLSEVPSDKLLSFWSKVLL